jgi:hypothetical protein
MVKSTHRVLFITISRSNFIMPVHHETKALFFSLPNTPFVGLINERTHQVVLAPCIPQKVCLILNEEQEVISGGELDDLLKKTRDIEADELDELKRLFGLNYLPRLLVVPESDEALSAHELLFEQQCKPTNKFEWGGFALTLDASGTLNYTFSSGAFNSPRGRKRIKGASLSAELVTEILKQTEDLVLEPGKIKLEAGAAPVPQLRAACDDSPARQFKRFRLFPEESPDGNHRAPDFSAGGTSSVLDFGM